MGRTAAFTLVETLFGALLISLVLFVVVSLYPSSLMGLRQAHDRVTAANLAQQEIETLRAQSFVQIAAPDPFETDSDGTRFRIETAVSPTHTRAVDGAVDVKSVQVTVSWSEQNGGPLRQVQTQTSLFYFQ